MAVSAAGHTQSRLFFVTDYANGFRFLVDTGAEISVIPPSRTDRLHRQGNQFLQAVNNTSIATTFQWVFTVADIKNPILGADFLQHFGLSVDVGRKRLSDALTHLSVNGIASQTTSPSLTLLPKKPANEFQAILLEFPTLLRPQTGDCEVKHGVTHHLQTKGPPVKARTRRLPPERLKVARRDPNICCNLG